MQEFGVQLTSNQALIIGGVVVCFIIGVRYLGLYFSRFNQDINDFFYSGQRFSWWLPAASMVATGIGSYSFLKYSQQGFQTGMSSSLTYMNDWFVLPFFMFGWLPIVYFSRIKSIPEYFERRFNRSARYISLAIILAYMLYYIGYNLFSIGVAIEGLFGVPMIYAVPTVAIFVGLYVANGGQTAVIFTDLFQGFMLYLAGGIALVTGLYALGGVNEFWSFLPETHRLPFVHLTDDPKFNTAGLFWGEALAGSIAFAFMNQGFLMRYLTIKSIQDGRKAAAFNLIVTLPVSAIVVGCVGWIAKSIIVKQEFVGGALPGMDFIAIENPFYTFLVVAWQTLQQNPWIFGFVIAALIAALMSTIDTLINACAAVGIYDIYKPLMKPEADSAHYLKAARIASYIATAIGLVMVIWFAKQRGSLMSIHYKGIMVIIPSIVTGIFLGAFWKGFTAMGANTSMVFGSLITLFTVSESPVFRSVIGVVSLVAGVIFLFGFRKQLSTGLKVFVGLIAVLPILLSGFSGDLIGPLSEFVGGPVNGKYIYMRALFGILIASVLGVIVSLFTEKKEDEALAGLTVWNLWAGMRVYKGGEPSNEFGDTIKGLKYVISESVEEGFVKISKSQAATMKAQEGDLAYISDNRWHLGGLRSGHIKVIISDEAKDGELTLSKKTFNRCYLLENKPISIEKIL